eukprot:TRINITY_DN2337_c0_g2_i1.p1 TRINITY_DN2337_c0_g2~~TRINITY_DN2337_c0_g2_i1.p1  ORF type:complete len:283 (+),score=67.34 TRINITY_DN2337_c0_g2_i1:54-902(+)
MYIRMGAVAVLGDINNYEAMLEGMKGCEVVYHLAAKVEIEGEYDEYEKINVEGTKVTLKAAKAAGVKTFVHCSTESVLLGGPPLVNADETWPYPPNPSGPYALSKGFAERAVVGANEPHFKTVVVRPRLIWGADDTSVMAKMIAAVQRGQFAWIGGGTHFTSTCHVDNVVEGMVKAAEHGRGGEIYFLTDGDAHQFKDFITRLLATQDVDVSNCRNIYGWVGSLLSWGGLIPAPALSLFGEECTVKDDKARKELGYKGLVTLEQGLKGLREHYLASKEKQIK